MLDYSLSQILQAEKTLCAERTIELLVAILRSRSHSGDIHGQITLDRVLITSDVPVRIKILPADRHISADPEFSAPEILCGCPSKSSDIYSIGAIGICLLTGLRPFQLLDAATSYWIWQDYWWQSPQPHDCQRIDRAKLAKILDRAISEHPDDRFSSAAEMLDALHDCAPELIPAVTNWFCQHILTGHHGLFAAIKAIAISPHGSIVATGSEDRTIRLWDLGTGNQVGILIGHQREIETLVFHPDRDELLFSGSKDGRIKLWQIDCQTELTSIDTHQTKVNSLAINRDRRYLASAGSNLTIKIWSLDLNVSTEIDCLLTFKAHRLAVNGVAFNPIDSEVELASVSSDRTVMLWRLDRPNPLAILNAHTQAVRTLAFSHDGELLATAGDDGFIQIWNVQNRQLKQTLSAHRWTISALFFMQNTKILISASWSGEIKYWDLNNGGSAIDTIAGSESEILALTVTSDGKYTIAGGRDKIAKVFRSLTIDPDL